MNRNIVLALAGVAVLALSACAPPQSANTGGAAPATPAASSTASVTIGASGGATFAKYSKIRIGMTYQEVVQIMGNEGALRNNPNKTADDKGPNKATPAGTMVYAWISSTPGNTNVMHVTFVNNRVTAKDQAGLP
jgi:hypothetical protein